MRNPNVTYFAAVTILLMIASNSVTMHASAAGRTIRDQASLTYLPLVITPIDLFILPNHSAYATPWGSLHIAGEVRNNTNVNLSAVSISADLFNSRGQYLASEAAYIYQEKLPAGRKACFEVIFLDPPSGWDSYRFNTPGYLWSSERLPNLTLISSSGAYDARNGEYKVEGQVRNDEGNRVEYVRPVSTLYSTSGRVLGCRYSYVSSVHLNSGQVSPFTIEFYGRDYGNVSTYLVEIDGNAP